MLDNNYFGQPKIKTERRVPDLKSDFDFCVPPERYENTAVGEVQTADKIFLFTYPDILCTFRIIERNSRVRQSFRSRLGS